MICEGNSINNKNIDNIKGERGGQIANDKIISVAPDSAVQPESGAPIKGRLLTENMEFPLL